MHKTIKGTSLFPTRRHSLGLCPLMLPYARPSFVPCSADHGLAPALSKRKRHFTAEIGSVAKGSMFVHGQNVRAASCRDYVCLDSRSHVMLHAGAAASLRTPPR